MGNQLKYKCKVMFYAVTFFLLNFIPVNSYDNSSDYYIHKRNIPEQKGMCDLSKVNNINFDYNKLYKKEGYSIQSDNKIFYLNICGPAPRCGANVAICYKTLNSAKINILGYFENISFGNELIRYKARKTNPVIQFYCNRHLKNAIIQRTGYKFHFKSNLVCYPKPTVCSISDSDDYTYDISSLYKNKDNWVVKNVPNEFKIYLNLCGNFNPISDVKDFTECSYEGTQICLVYDNGTSTNLGVFSEPILKNDDDNLSLRITGGSLCNADSITTNIKFICSNDEQGPTFISYSNCEYNIIWFTSTSCPHRIYEGNNCMLQDPIFNHKKMSFSKETVRVPNTSLIVKYNICDNTINCNNETVSFCLIDDKGQEKIIGRFNDDYKLISHDGLLTMEYSGDNCTANNKIKHHVHLKLTCNYMKNIKPEIQMSQDHCTTNLTVHTIQACVDFETHLTRDECFASVNNSGIMYYYNISELTLTNRNYEIKNVDDSNLIYILNVCQPIVLQPGTYFHSTAIVCARNESIANIKKKTKTLGHLGKSKLTVLKNESLLIQYDGDICFSKSRNYFLTTIEFICNNEARNTQPILLSKADCEYYFQWETQFACPIINNTLPKQIKNNNEADDTSISNRINKDSSVVVGLKNNTQEYSLKMNTRRNDSVPVEITTEHVTKKTMIQIIEDQITKKPMDVIEEQFTKKPMKVVEKEQIARKSADVFDNILSTSLFVPIEVANTSGLFIKNCTFEDFNMYSLPRIVNVTSETGKLYSINICNTFPKTIDCKSKNCLSKLHMDAARKHIEFDFLGQTKCNDGYYNSVMYMKCSEKFLQPSIIKEDSCSVELEWKNSAVCALLQEKPQIIPKNKFESKQTGHIVPILVSVFVILFIVVITVFLFRYFWRKRKNISNSPSCFRRCDYSRVKDSAKII